jgi:hypothetical protein
VTQDTDMSPRTVGGEDNLSPAEADDVVAGILRPDAAAPADQVTVAPRRPAARPISVTPAPPKPAPDQAQPTVSLPAPARTPTAAAPTVGQRSAARSAAATGGSGRSARLILRTVDPWSVLRFSFLFSLAALVVLLVAVLAIWVVLDRLGVFDQIISLINDFASTGSNAADGTRSLADQVAEYLDLSTVLGYAAIIGGVNVVLITVVSTLVSFCYNLISRLVGGLEVELAEPRA